MSQIITIREFAEKLAITEPQAKRVLRANKFLQVKVVGIRQPLVDMDKFEAKKLLSA